MLKIKMLFKNKLIRLITLIGLMNIVNCAKKRKYDEEKAKEVLDQEGKIDDQEGKIDEAHHESEEEIMSKLEGYLQDPELESIIHDLSFDKAYSYALPSEIRKVLTRCFERINVKYATIKDLEKATKIQNRASAILQKPLNWFYKHTGIHLTIDMRTLDLTIPTLCKDSLKKMHGELLKQSRMPESKYKKKIIGSEIAIIREEMQNQHKKMCDLIGHVFETILNIELSQILKLCDEGQD